MEVSHLEPIGLILDADVIQLNEYLGRFNVVATVPLERRAQRRFYFCFMCVQAIECSLVFLLISSAKYDLCPRCIKVCYAAKIEATYTKEAIDPVISCRISLSVPSADLSTDTANVPV